MTTINILDLSKKFQLNLEKVGVLQIPTLRTKLAVDKSGSMDEEFRDGLVERTIALFTGAALKFDDDGKLEMGFFNTSMTLTEDAQASDNGNYLRRVRQSAGGGTSYAPIIRAFEGRRVLAEAAPAPAAAPEKKGFFAGIFSRGAAAPAPAAPAANPNDSEFRSYVGIVTDGDAGDERQFEAEMAKSSGDTFYQFIAIGNGVTTRYLTEIAAKYPHVAFLHLPEPKKTSDDDFYKLLCNDKFAAWIKSA